MWCFYSSNDIVLFHVKPREDFSSEAANSLDAERLEKAWGTRHRYMNNYLYAQDGDHLMVPFECDLFVFRKLRGSSPLLVSDKDDLLLACIGLIWILFGAVSRWQ
jgi:hypothetical protein